jgi:hypothetical protein
MTVKAAVRAAGASYDRADADAVEAALAKQARRGFHDPLAVFGRLVSADSHLGASFPAKPLTRYMTTIINHLSMTIAIYKSQKRGAERSQLAIASHFSAFDKADESLPNDYEELLTELASDSELAVDFKKIINAFLTTDPISVNADINWEWDGTSSVAMAGRCSTRRSKERGCASGR